LPKRDSQSALTLEDTADRTRQPLPMYTSGPRAPVRITVGLTAIGRSLTGAISGWRDIGRDGHITTTPVAAIGTATAIVDMGSETMTGIGIATMIVDIAETGRLYTQAEACTTSEAKVVQASACADQFARRAK
jgi:hypothetical protein